MIRHHLAVWWTGIDRGTAALAATAAAGLVAGAVMLVLVHSHRTGIPAITLALPGLIALWACCTVASAFTISPRPVVRCRAGVPDAAPAFPGAPGTAAPAPGGPAGAAPHTSARVVPVSHLALPGRAPTPSRVEHGWAVRPAVTSRAAGRHQLPARARSRVRYAPGRVAVPPGAAVTQMTAAAAPGHDHHQTTAAPAVSSGRG